MNLGICDVLLCMTAIPMAPLVFFAYNWHLGLALCKFMPFCQATSVIVTQLSLCSIALDRFRNIVYPQKRNWNLATARAITVGNWLFACIFNAPLIFAHKLINYKNICGEFCMENWSLDWFKNVSADQYKHYYGIVILALTYAAPLLLQCFCFVRILIKVQRDMIKDPHARSHSPRNRNAATKKRRVMYTLILMMIAFAFSWLPLTMVNVLRDWNVNWAFLNYQPFMFQLTAHCIAMTCVVWNPVLYFWMGKKHRQALRRDILGKIASTLQASTILSSPNCTTQHSLVTGTVGSGHNSTNIRSSDSDHAALISGDDSDRPGLPRLRSHSPERLRGEINSCRRQFSLNRAPAPNKHISFELRSVYRKEGEKNKNGTNGHSRYNGRPTPGTQRIGWQMSNPEHTINYRTPGQVIKRQRAIDNTTSPIYV
uniref:G-protein coupled receptors family 1 profile domain-containing protein n=1 Tax=Plectus sambesii TaxID=2011161 RepID=A0A914XAL2_9BILA